jgi:hypothetical protein
VNATKTAAGNAARLSDSFAQVRTADHITRYTRVGTGRPVLVLDERSAAETLWPGLIDRLALERRVLVPEVPADEPRFTAWLRGFIDGMGLPQLTLVAVSDLCVPSIEFTLLEPERIERLVLVPSGRVEETGLSGAISSTLGSADVEMLVVRRDFPSAEAILVIERFLRGERS